MASTTTGRVALLMSILASAQETEAQEVRKKRLWSRSWLPRRDIKSVYDNLVQELRLDDMQGYYDFTRMSKTDFHELLQLVTPLIVKTDTNMRKAVTPQERLAVTLRYLATGESRRTLAINFKFSHNLICKVIPSVCEAIYKVLKPLYLKVPNTEEEWQKVAHQFFTRWNFPNCIGALAGKRVLISRPSKIGSELSEYRTQHCVFLLATVDADYKFLYVNAESCDGASDAGVWDECSLHEAMEADMLNVPGPATLPLSNIECPYTILGDDTFPHKPYLMKPYSGKRLTKDNQIFNYRLSRARHVSENAFGILAAKFRVFKKPIATSPENVQGIILCTLALHNFLRTKTAVPQELLDREHLETNTKQPGQWRKFRNTGLVRLPVSKKRHSIEASVVRENLKRYFNNEGQVPWQEQMSLMH